MKKATLLLSTCLSVFALLLGAHFATPKEEPVEAQATTGTSRYFFDCRKCSPAGEDWVPIFQTYNANTGQDVQHPCTKLFDQLWVIDIDMTPYTGCKFAWAHSSNIHDPILYFEWDAKTGANYCLTLGSYQTEWYTISTDWEMIGRQNVDDEWGTLASVPLTNIGLNDEYGIRFYADVDLPRHSEFCLHSDHDEYAGILNSNISDLFDRDGEINQLADYPYVYYTTTGACLTGRKYGDDANNFIVCEEGHYRVGVYPLVSPRACVYARGVNFPFKDSQCYIRGTVKSLGLYNDWTKGVPIGQWTYDAGNQWFLGKFAFTEGDRFKFYIEGFGNNGGWIGIEAWDGRTTDDMGFDSDEDGNILAPSRDLYMYITEDWTGYYDWYGQHVSSAYIYGRVDSLGLDGDSVYRCPLPDWKGVYLKTTDHFHINRLDHFYRTFNNEAVIDEESQSLLAVNPEPDDHEIRVKADGYYDLVNVNDAWLLIRKSAIETAQDGMYVCGEYGHWDVSNMRKMTQIGPNRYAVGPLHLSLYDELKCVFYKGGVSHWCEWHTYSSANYRFRVGISDANFQIQTGGDYYLVLTKDGDYFWNYYFMDPAEGWASMFLRSMTCDGQGVDEPEFADGYSWKYLKSAFQTLDDESKERIFAAEADANGNVIEEAVARYELLVAGHGYEKFIRNASGTLRASNGVAFESTLNPGQSKALLALGIIVGASAVITSAALLGRKRKRRQ